MKASRLLGRVLPCPVIPAYVHCSLSPAALSDSVAKESCMLNLLLSLPEPNLVTFLFLLDHLKRLGSICPGSSMRL